MAEIRQRAYWANVSAEATPQAHAALRLCATVKAQAEVIQQISNGWQYALPPNFRAGTWFRLARVGTGLSIQVEAMPETHQLILYGKVVLPESA